MTTSPNNPLNTNTAYVLLKQDHAPKLGPRSTGGITYVVLADEAHQHLYLQITGNDGGGYWSREIVSVADIERCLPEKADEHFPAKRLASAFSGRSSNNGGFLAAVLHHEGLLARADGKDQRAAHVRAGDWSTWTAAMLAMAGEPYVPAGQKSEPESLAMDVAEIPLDTDRPKKGKRKAELPEAEHADLA